VVQEGETLYRIARQYGVDLDELMDLNQISDPRTLAVGRELALPPRRESAGGTPTRAASAQVQAPASGAPRDSSAGGVSREAPTSPAASVRSAPSGDAPSFIWPVKGVVYSRFGARGASRHDGIDIAAPEGTPILAAAEGEVIYSGVQRGYGNLVILRHVGGLVTIYAHNRENLVREGDRVGKGQTIGKVGRTGRATGPHVHFEVRRGTKPIDPQTVLPR
jgi:murein DD-endopeptidase MepM/ murein hydrolase activator NlpD